MVCLGGPRSRRGVQLIGKAVGRVAARASVQAASPLASQPASTAAGIVCVDGCRLSSRTGAGH
jgi:hypothetical protein